MFNVEMEQEDRAGQARTAPEDLAHRNTSRVWQDPGCPGHVCAASKTRGRSGDAEGRHAALTCLPVAGVIRSGCHDRNPGLSLYDHGVQLPVNQAVGCDRAMSPQDEVNRTPRLASSRKGLQQNSPVDSIFTKSNPACCAKKARSGRTPAQNANGAPFGAPYKPLQNIGIQTEIALTRAARRDIFRATVFL